MSVSSFSSAAKPGVCLSTDRPDSPFDGQVIYETDTNRTLVYDNSAWVVIADPSVLSIDTNNDRVGIGTTSPSRNLHIQDASSGATAYGLTGGIDIETDNISGLNILSPNTGYGRLYFGAPVSNTAGAVEYIHNATLTDGYMKFRAGAADRMHILGNGNVGIGTASPDADLEISATNAVLKITSNENDPLTNHSGLILFENTNISDTYDAAAIKINAGSDAARNGSITFQTNPTGTTTPNGLIDRMIIDELGNVGIGTTSPNASLEVARSSNGLDDVHFNGQVRIDGADPSRLTFGATNSANLWSIDNASGTLRFFRENWSATGSGTSGAVRMAITDAGNVGIGTTSPTAELDITSTSDATINLNGGVDNTNNINFHAHDSGAFWHLSAPRSGDDAFRFYYYNGSSYVESLYQNTGGNIGAKGIYDLTTPATSSLVHSSTSSYQYRLFRSTSRRDAKTDIESITDDNALALLQSRPVWFRSALSHDDPTLSYYGFIAEELAEIDPRLCTWEAGRVLKEGDYASENERLCTCPDNENLVHTFDHEPECIQVAGVDYGRLTAHLTKIAQMQQSTIDSQQTQIDALTARIEALEAN